MFLEGRSDLASTDLVAIVRPTLSDGGWKGERPLKDLHDCLVNSVGADYMLALNTHQAQGINPLWVTPIGMHCSKYSHCSPWSAEVMYYISILQNIQTKAKQ